MTNDKQIIKHSQTTQIINEISLLGRKCWNILLMNAFNDLEHKDKFEISGRELMKMLDLKGNNYDHLRKTIKNVMGTIVQINLLKKDKEKVQGWEMMTLLQYASFKDGLIKYEFNHNLQKKLIENGMYVKIKLAMQNKLTSKYSLALYELCLDYFDKNKVKSYTPFMTIPKFKLLVMGNEKKYEQKFKSLKFYVINKAVKEINEKTEIEIKPKFKKWKRSITEIQFEIKRKGLDIRKEIKKDMKEEEEHTKNSILEMAKRLGKI